MHEGKTDARKADSAPPAAITPNDVTASVIAAIECGEGLYGPYDTVDELMEALNDSETSPR